MIADPRETPERTPIRVGLEAAGGHVELRRPSDGTPPERVIELVRALLTELLSHGFSALAPGVGQIGPQDAPGPLLRAYSEWIGYVGDVT